MIYRTEYPDKKTAIYSSRYDGPIRMVKTKIISHESELRYDVEMYTWKGVYCVDFCRRILPEREAQYQVVKYLMEAYYE